MSLHDRGEGGSSVDARENGEGKKKNSKSRANTPTPAPFLESSHDLEFFSLSRSESLSRGL